MTGLVAAFFGVLVIGFAVWKHYSRRGAGLRRFPAEWEKVLADDFAVYLNLSPEEKETLKARILKFLNSKSFEACGRLEQVSDADKLLVAAQACLLLIGRPKEKTFPRLKSILIYPGAFVESGRRTFIVNDPDYDEDISVRLGESWSTGSVILALDSVRRGAANDDDGINVVIHEFAHQLDQKDGAADGVPTLDSRRDYREWAEIMNREYEKLLEDVESPGDPPLLDPYGAENPAEFFSVVSETFFEKPKQLRKLHPDLFRELSDYYNVNPVQWK